MKVIARNKRARFDYELLKEYETGIKLQGAEIKSIREGNVHLKGSFVSVRSGEVFWKGGFIKRWKTSSDNIDENRERKLLLHKREIAILEKGLNEKGNTLVPLELGLVRGRAKMRIALARGKRKYDKRESIKKREIDRKLRTQEKYG